MTETSVEALVKKILTYMARPLSEFSKHDVLEMMESLHNKANDKRHDKANYYRLAYQTARNNIEKPRAQFHSLVTRLIGDKDHEKVLDIEAKVAKYYKASNSMPRSRVNNSPYYRRPLRRQSTGVRCFECNGLGHFKANCPLRAKNVDGKDSKRKMTDIL